MKRENEKLIIAISSRALFDLMQSHQVYEREGVDAYCKYQIENEDVPLDPGVAFDLVTKLLALNIGVENSPLVEIILLSRNSADTGLRVFNSIHHHELAITRAVFTSGASTHPYVSAFGAHLFLSSDADEVRHALENGDVAATILPSAKSSQNSTQLRIAFDGDSVLFSDEAERVFQSQGLDQFQKSEQDAARTPLSEGPFKKFLEMLHKIQSKYSPDQSPIRTALVTARAAPAHERAIRTLRDWNVRTDEVMFLGGLPKGPFLNAFGADIFFDDQHGHCESARQYVPTGHVPSGIKNE
jgi:5'-nucleotidase